MPPAADPNLLRSFVLSVGQADTSVCVTPDGNVIVIDAVRPDKLRRLLRDIGVAKGDPISLLVITHPHDDHYRGANFLFEEHEVGLVALAPFWCEQGKGTPTYWQIVGRAMAKNIPLMFVSGYNRIYPDRPKPGEPQVEDWESEKPFVELIGPSNAILGELGRAGDLETNHLSVMTRLQWQKFRMVFAADAQMENWANYDREGMLEESCKVLRTSHHGSANGTQWERLRRLDPRAVLVSSDPAGQHHLPDLVGASIFAKLEAMNSRPATKPKRIVALTHATGSVEVRAKKTGGFDLVRYKDQPAERIDMAKATALRWNNNPTDWGAVLRGRIDAIYGTE